MEISEGWKVEEVEDHGVKGFIVRTPREKGVRFNTSIWEDTDDHSEQILFLILTEYFKGK